MRTPYRTAAPVPPPPPPPLRTDWSWSELADFWEQRYPGQLLPPNCERELQDLKKQIAAIAVADPREAQQPAPGLTLQVVNAMTPSAPLTAASASATPSDGGASSPSEKESRAQRVDNLEAFFVSDRPATGWGGQAEMDARRRLETALPPGSSLQSFDCHETVCRIATAHQSRDDFRQYVHAAFMSPQTSVWNAHFYVALNDDDAQHPTAVAFIAREGQAWPTVQPQ